MTTISNISELAVTLNVLIGIVTAVFIVCESGERVSDKFESFAMKLSQSDWHSLSIKMQRIFLVFLAHTQQTPNIRGYGNILCTRVTFKKVFFFRFHDYLIFSECQLTQF